MKKLLYTMSLFAAATAFSAENLTVDSDITKSGTFGNIEFTKTATVTASGHIYGDDLTIDEGVDAQFKTENQVAVYLGNSKDTETAVISGAGADKSSLTTRMWVFTTKNWASHQGLLMKDITFNMIHDTVYSAQNNVLRAGAMTFDSIVFNVKGSTFNSNIVNSGTSDLDAFTFNNSSLNIADDGKLAFVRDGSFVGNAVAAFNNSTIENNGYLSNTSFAWNLNNSKFIQNGTLNGTLDMTLADSAVEVADGKTMTVGKLNASGNSSINAIGSFSATGTTVNSGVLNVSGKNASFKAIQNSGRVYLNSETLTVGGDIAASTGYFYIGQDADGNAYDVNASFNGGFQGNSVYFIANAATKTTINTGVFVLADASKMSVINKNVEISGSGLHSRMVSVNFDGKITTTGRQNTTDGWDYSLSFGVYSSGARPNQIGTVVIGENAEVNVLPTVSTYFGFIGDITIKAGEGKLVSNSNAQMYIYSDSTGSKKTTFRLASTDAFAVGGAASQAQSTFHIKGADIDFVVQADNNIGKIAYADASSLIRLSIENGSVLTLGSFENLADDGTIKIVLGDISQGSLRILDMDDVLSDYGNQSKISFVDADGNARVLDSNLYIEKLASGGYDIFTQIPEPATCAVALGGLAIAFALMRRRR